MSGLGAAVMAGMLHHRVNIHMSNIPDMSEVLDTLVLCEWLSLNDAAASEEELVSSLPDCSFDVVEHHEAGGEEGSSAEFLSYYA